MATISKEVNIDILEKLADGSFKKKNPSTTIGSVSGLTGKLNSLQHESGSNDDGYWVKLPEGTLICMRTYHVNGNVGRSGGAATAPLPAFFQSESRLFAGCTSNNTGLSIRNIEDLTDVVATASSREWQIRAGVETMMLDQTLVLFAIGR